MLKSGRLVVGNTKAFLLGKSIAFDNIDSNGSVYIKKQMEYALEYSAENISYSETLQSSNNYNFIVAESSYYHSCAYAIIRRIEVEVNNYAYELGDGLMKATLFVRTGNSSNSITTNSSPIGTSISLTNTSSELLYSTYAYNTTLTANYNDDWKTDSDYIRTYYFGLAAFRNQYNNTTFNDILFKSLYVKATYRIYDIIVDI